MGVLGSKRTLNRITSANGGITLAELYALYGYKKFIVNYGLMVMTIYANSNSTMVLYMV